MRKITAVGPKLLLRSLKPIAVKKSALLYSFLAKIVPPTGDTPHKELSEQKAYPTQAEAKAAFEKAKDRLLHPQQWAGLTGNFGAAFQPFRADCTEIWGKVTVGDYLKIDIPLPGDNYDWVKIEALEEISGNDEQIIGLRVRPTEDLEKPGHETAHFFSREATSTWVLHLEGKTLTALYFGRGEVPNEEAPGFWKGLRDTVVAWAGVAGFSDLQWQRLLQGLLGKEI